MVIKLNRHITTFNNILNALLIYINVPIKHIYRDIFGDINVRLLKMSLSEFLRCILNKIGLLDRFDVLLSDKLRGH